MKSLRQYIRQILIESPEMQDELDQLVHNREDQPYSSMDTMHREKEKEDTAKKRDDPLYVEDPQHPFPTDEEIDAKFDMRREVKKFWNENADHQFWQNPKSVIAIHDLSYYAELSGGEDVDFAEDVSQEHDLKIESFLKKYPPGARQKDEMSAYGFTSINQFLERNMDQNNISLAIVLNPRRVTYASSVDAYSESRGGASLADLERHKSSGLPKRPSVGRRFHGKSALFDKADVKKAGKIGELIVDNWSYDTLIINSQYSEYFSQDRIKQIIELAKDHGLKVMDGQLGKEL